MSKYFAIVSHLSLKLSTKLKLDLVSSKISARKTSFLAIYLQKSKFLYKTRSIPLTKVSNISSALSTVSILNLPKNKSSEKKLLSSFKILLSLTTLSLWIGLSSFYSSSISIFNTTKMFLSFR